MAHTSTEYRNWSWCCDSYGKVRHSRKACVYTVIMEPGGERSVQVASRIENWDDAYLIAAAPDMLLMLHTLRDTAPGIQDNPGLWAALNIVIRKAETGRAQTEG